MRYLKLFEAFDSIKLSKTFSYLNKEGKDKFLTDLKSVCNYLDYPLSKLSDEDFQYLPFKRAWDLNNPEADKLEMIKFWFNKDGNYIDKTVINGNNIDIYKGEMSVLPSDDLDDYIEISGNLPHSEVKNLQTGQLVRLRCSDGYGPAYIYKSPITDEVFAIQNFASGSTPGGRGDNYNHRNIARNSWVMADRDDYYSVRKIQYKNISEDDIVKVFNLKLDISEDNIYTSYDKKIEKESNFALVLDLTKLQGISLKDLRAERVERKQGAFLTDEQIKSENIERYFNEIFKTEKIISDPNRVIKRLLIGKDILFFYRRLYMKETMANIKDYYYYAISSTETNDQEAYIAELRRDLFSFNKKYNKKKISVLDTIKYLKEELSSDKEIGGNHSNETYLEYLNNLEELSEIIYNKLSEIKVENIYDIEGVYNKLNILDMILNDNKNHFRRSLNFIGSLYDKDNSKYYLTDSYENEDLLEFNKTGFNRIKELVKRL
jgi:hypothetical protein